MRKHSPESKARLSEIAKERWAKAKSEGKNTIGGSDNPLKKRGKRGPYKKKTLQRAAKREIVNFCPVDGTELAGIEIHLGMPPRFCPVCGTELDRIALALGFTLNEAQETK
jgi:hypothetical protein